MSKVLQGLSLIKKNSRQLNKLAKLIKNTPNRFNGLALSGPASSRHFSVQQPQISFPAEHIDGHGIVNGFTKLKYDIERQNRVLKASYDTLTDSLINKIGKVSNVQASALIAAVDHLYEESNLQRVAIANNLWDNLKKIGAPLDVSHYNALLYIYVENKFEFTPTQFLAQMEQDNIEPNRVTYQFLISKYCQEGNVDQAQKILEYMKEKSIGINESIFNSLIAGNLKANNIEEAKNVFQVMKEGKLKPTVNTYTALLKGFAEIGNIEGIRQTYEELEREKMFLPLLNTFEVLTSLAVNGHEQYLDEIIEKSPKPKFFSPRCLRHIYNLINADKVEAAFKLFSTLPSVQNDIEHHNGLFFIKHLIKTGQPIDTVKLFCDKLHEINPKCEGYLKALEASYIYNKAENAFGLLNALHSRQVPLRQQYFWPLLVHYANANNINGYINVIKHMKELNCTINIQTLCEIVIPNCPNLEMVENQATELGVHKSVFAYAKFQNAVEKREFESALKYAKDKNFLIFAQKHMISVLAESYKISRNENRAQLIAQILTQLKKVDNQNQSPVINGLFLNQLFGIRQTDMNELISAFKESGLKIHQGAFDQCKRYFKKDMQLINDIESIVDTEHIMSYINEEDISESEKMERQASRRRPDLLILQCRAKDFEKSHETLAEMETNNETITPNLYASLMDMCTATDHLEEALGYKLKIYELDPEFKIRTYKIINLALKMIESNRFDDAFQLLSEHKVDEQVVKSFYDRTVHILHVIAMTGNVERTTQMYNLLTKGGYVPVNNRTYGSLIRACIVNNDFEAALEKLEECSKNNKFTPLKHELISKFIELEDAEKLQRVVDVCTKVHGEISSLYDLALCFLELGREAEAQKIFETPGLRAINERLHFVCANLVKANKVTLLEAYVKMCQNLFDVDKEMLCYHLMQGYGQEGDYNKALSVWEDMQEQNILPTQTTLEYLAELLESHGQSVPFTVNRSESKIESANEPTKNLAYLIGNNKVDDAIKLLKNLKENYQPKIALLKTFLRSLADAGKLESLYDLKDNIQESQKRLFSIDYFIQLGHKQNGTYEKIFDEIASGKSFMLNFELLNEYISANPDKYNKVKDAVYNISDEEESIHGRCMLWNVLFSKKDFEGAQQICDDTPRLKNWINYQPLVTLIKSTQDEDLAKRLSEFLCSTDSNIRSKGYAVGIYAHTLARNNKFDEAVQTLRTFMSENGPEGITLKTLYYIRDTFVLAKRQFPIEIPEYKE